MVSVEDRLLENQRKKEMKLRKMRDQQLQGLFTPKVNNKMAKSRNSKRKSLKRESSNTDFEGLEFFFDMEEKEEIEVMQEQKEDINSREVYTKENGGLERKKKHRRIKSSISKPSLLSRKESQRSISRQSSQRKRIAFIKKPPKSIIPHQQRQSSRKEIQPLSRKNSTSNMRKRLGQLKEEFNVLNRKYSNLGGRKHSKSPLNFEESSQDITEPAVFNMKQIYKEENQIEAEKMKIPKKREKRRDSSSKYSKKFSKNYSTRKFEEAKRSVRSSRSKKNQDFPKSGYLGKRRLSYQNSQGELLSRNKSGIIQEEVKEKSDWNSKSSFEIIKNLKKCSSKENGSDFVVQFKHMPRGAVKPPTMIKSTSVRKIEKKGSRGNLRMKLETPKKTITKKNSLKKIVKKKSVSRNSGANHSVSIEKLVQNVSGKKKFLEDNESNLPKRLQNSQKSRKISPKKPHIENKNQVKKTVNTSTFEDAEFQLASENLLAAIYHNQNLGTLEDTHDISHIVKIQNEDFNEKSQLKSQKSSQNFFLKNEVLNLDDIIASKIGNEATFTPKSQKKKTISKKEKELQEFKNFEKLNFNIIEGNYLAEPKSYSKIEGNRRRIGSRSSKKSRNLTPQRKNFDSQNSLKNLSNGYSSNYSRKHSNSEKKNLKRERKSVKKFKLVKKIGKKGGCEVKVVPRDLEDKIDNAFGDLRKRLGDVSIYDEDFIISGGR